MNQSTPPLVLLIQRFLPHYRVEFFELLAGRLRDAGLRFRVLYSRTLGTVHLYPWAEELPAWCHDIEVRGIRETLVVAPTLLPRLHKLRPSLVIMEDLAGLPSSLVAAAYCRLKTRPYLVWGLGRIPHKDPSRLRTVLAPAIRFLYSASSGFIAYSSAAAEVYRQFGKGVYVAPNACRPAHTEAEVARIEQAISDRTRDSVVRLVAIGRLLEQKQFHLVLWALAELGRSDIELDLVGEGPAELQLRDLTARLGLTERVRFHGGLYEPEEKWLVASRCHLGVLPGRGGLAVQELMWYGLPVVTGVADGTELDLVEEGVNGYVVNGGLDVQSIAERIERFVQTPLSGRTAMARAALETVRSQSNIGIMVERFMDAVTATLDAQRAATGAGGKSG